MAFPLARAALAIVSFTQHNNYGIGVYMLFVALSTTVIELGAGLTCMPLLHKLYEVMIRLCCLGNWIVRGGIYVLLSILMFWGMRYTQIAGGALCVLTGVVYAIGGWNGGSTTIRDDDTATSDYTAA